MIQRLKIKFIAINMTFVMLVMFLLLGSFFVSEYKNEKQQIAYNLELSVEKQGDFRPSIGGRPEDNKEENSDLSLIPLTKVMPTFTVEVDENGNLVHVEDSHVHVENITVNQAVKEVLSSQKETGMLRDISLRYRVKKQGNTSVIAFLDVSLSDTYLRGVFCKLLLVLFVGFLVFLMISMYLAKITVRPVEKAWNRQKQFIADASHELKTPLTVILTNLDIIEAHKEDTILAQQKWIVNTKKEADRMKQLLEDLLFLAKSDASSMPVIKQEIDFSYVVLGTTLLFESIAYESQIQLEEEIEEDIFIMGDEKQLKQLVAILLDNACKYSRNGRVNVTLKRIQEKILLEVKNEIKYEEDLIPKEDIEHIFERFYRVDKSRARKEGGYGLGLSIALTIVENHHGKIKVKSSMDEGTVFSISFPVKGDGRNGSAHKADISIWKRFSKE